MAKTGDTVSIRYLGIVLGYATAESSPVREVNQGGLFWASDIPMPVATRLFLECGDARTEVFVARVREADAPDGTPRESGMSLTPVDAAAWPQWVLRLSDVVSAEVKMRTRPARRTAA